MNILEEQMSSNTSKGVKVAQAAAPAGPTIPSATQGSAAGEKPKWKACSSCPETKRARDQCIVERGEENCTTLIEAHKKYMRNAGFNI